MRASEALAEVRRLAVAGRVQYSRHAEERMVMRFVRREDVESALRNARGCRAANGDCWRVEGPDADGDDLTVVVAVEAGVLVVTVF